MRSLIAITIFGFTVLGASQADAGQTFNPAGCYRAGDGSGYCYGTFAGIRGNDATADAVFRSDVANGSTYASFSEELNGQYYSCVFPSNGSMSAPVSQVLGATNLYFQVNWDANGNCWALDVRNGTLYSP